jgi:hypothetical protein
MFAVTETEFIGNDEVRSSLQQMDEHQVIIGPVHTAVKRLIVLFGFVSQRGTQYNHAWANHWISH